MGSLCFVFLEQDLDQVQLHLEEVRFFDVFGFSEAAGAWQCFMCNNPEKATGESPLLSTCCSESLVPLGFTGTSELCISRWPSSHILCCNNTQECLIASVLCWERYLTKVGVREREDVERGRDISQKQAREATPYLYVVIKEAVQAVLPWKHSFQPRWPWGLGKKQPTSQKPRRKEIRLREWMQAPTLSSWGHPLHSCFVMELHKKWNFWKVRIWGIPS